MNRHIRYQAAIVKDYHMLLIKQAVRSGTSIKGTFWLVPGGGIEPGESESDCVRREVKEETGLDVEVQSLLLEEPDPAPDGIYQRILTYLCEPIGGEAKPGYEPEDPDGSHSRIDQVRWFDLRDETNWLSDALNDSITCHHLRSVRDKLGLK